MRNPFRRRGNNQTIAELESYYASQGSNRRTGTAWVMAILSLIITVAVIVALYFGVRWAYRALTDNNNGTDTVATGTVDSENGGARVIGENNDPRSSDDVVIGVVNPSADEAIDNDEQGGVVSDEAASTTRDSSDVAGRTSNDSSDSLVTTGGDELPDTGAGELLIAIPALTIAIGYFISRKQQLR